MRKQRVRICQIAQTVGLRPIDAKKLESDKLTLAHFVFAESGNYQRVADKLNLTFSDVTFLDIVYDYSSKQRSKYNLTEPFIVNSSKAELRNREIIFYSQQMYLSCQDVTNTYGIGGFASTLLRKLTGNSSGERLLRWLDYEAKAGRDTVEISNLLEVSIGWVRTNARKKGIVVSDTRYHDSAITKKIEPKTPREFEEIEAITKGLSITEIGNKFGYTREYARIRILNYDLYDQWKVARRRVKDIAQQNTIPFAKKTKRDLLVTLINRAQSLTKLEHASEQQDYRLALAYFRQSAQTPFHKIYSCLRIYREWPADEKFSINKLHFRAGIEWAVCKKILRYSGLAVVK